MRVSAAVEHPASARGRSKQQEVPNNESENYTGLHRMQAPQLCNQEEQAEQSRTD